jgi:hypothetical protein
MVLGAQEYGTSLASGKGLMADSLKWQECCRDATYQDRKQETGRSQAHSFITTYFLGTNTVPTRPDTVLLEMSVEHLITFC